MDSLSCRFLSPWKQLSGLPSRRSDTQKSDASRCALLGSSRTPLFLSNFSSRTHFAKERKASLHHIPKAIARLSASATSLVPSTSEIEVQDKSNEDSGPAEVKRLLLGLRNGALGQPELALPVTLTKKDRLVAHEWAEKLGLGHESQGTGKERRLTANRLGAKDRLEKYKELIDLEEEASSKSAPPGASWRQLESQSLLLRGAVLLEREAAAFGKERWIVGENADVSKKGHVAKFGQRARPGAAVRLALRRENGAGGWAVAENEPPGRVAWCRSGRMSIVFDRPPGQDEESDAERSATKSGGLDFLLVPDRATFDRMRSVINECLRAEGPMARFLEALLGASLETAAQTPETLAESLETAALTPETLAARRESNGAAGTSGLDETNGTGDGKGNGQRSQSLLAFREEGFEGLDTGLNEEQRRAVRLCVNGPEDGGGSPVALLHGPFGTGKTRTLVEVIRQRVRAGQRVLVAAASNAAVDNVATALLAADLKLELARAGVPERVSPALAAHTLESLQEQRPESAMAARLRRDAFAAVAASHKWVRAADGGQRRREARKEAAALFKDARKLERQAVTGVLRSVKVLCGTLTGFSGALQEVNDDDLRRFDCAVVDEASQAVTPALLLALPFLKYPTGADLGVNGPLLVLAGDHRQLPPTVIAEGASEKGGGLSATLFEELMERDGGGLGSDFDRFSGDEDKARLLETARGALLAIGDAERNRESCSGRYSAALRTQYRMPSALMAFPSAAFYGGGLRAGAPTEETRPLDGVSEGLATLREGCWLEVIDTAGAGFDEEKGEESGRGETKGSDFSTSNPGQAELTARVVRELLQIGGSLGPADVGVVTPYAAQVALLRELLAGEVAAGVEVDSVDGFQGREKAVIVFDCVRSNDSGSVGFLADQRRLNVAITRARRKLIIVGDSATLGADPIWAALFDWAGELVNPSGDLAYRSVFELPPTDGW